MKPPTQTRGTKRTRNTLDDTSHESAIPPMVAKVMGLRRETRFTMPPPKKDAKLVKLEQRRAKRNSHAGPHGIRRDAKKPKREEARVDEPIVMFREDLSWTVNPSAHGKLRRIARNPPPSHPLPPVSPDSSDVLHDHWQLDGGDTFVKAVRTVNDLSQCVLFKVHRTMLAAHLEPFYYMFAEDMPIPTDEMREGLPVIVTQQETAENWALMLQLLYIPESYANTGVASWQDVVTLLELSRKYCCKRFREPAAAFLTTEWPTRLEKFMRRDSKISGVPERDLAVRVLDLALKYDIPQILPVVYLDLARYPPQQLLGEWTLPEGETMTIAEDEVVRIVSGREKVLQMRRLYTLQYLNGFNTAARIQCSSRHIFQRYTCGDWMARLSRYVEQNADVFYDEPRKALQIFDGRTMVLMRGRLCEECRARFKWGMTRGQWDAWMDVPRVFGLGTWFDVERRAHEAVVREFRWGAEREYPKEEVERLKAAARARFAVIFAGKESARPGPVLRSST